MSLTSKAGLAATARARRTTERREDLREEEETIVEYLLICELVKKTHTLGPTLIAEARHKLRGEEECLVPTITPRSHV